MNISLYSWSYKSWTVGGFFLFFPLYIIYLFPSFFWCFLCFSSSCSTIWISFMDAHKTDVTSWCSRTPWRKCKSSSRCKKPERSTPKPWTSWKSPAVASQMWPITTSSTGNPCGRRKTSLTGQGIDLFYITCTVFLKKRWIGTVFVLVFILHVLFFFMMGEGPTNTQIMTSWKF